MRFLVILFAFSLTSGLASDMASVTPPSEGVTLEQHLEAARKNGAFVFIDGLNLHEMGEILSPVANDKQRFTTTYYEVNRAGDLISVNPLDIALRSPFLDVKLPPLSFDHVDLAVVIAKIGNLAHVALAVDNPRGTPHPVTLNTGGGTVREFLITLSKALNSRQVILSYGLRPTGERMPSVTYVLFKG